MKSMYRRARVVNRVGLPSGNRTRRPGAGYGSRMLSFLALIRSFATAVRRGWADPKFRAVTFLVIVLLVSGTLFYWRIEGWTVLDSLYFSVITLTTVGYGDLAPATASGKVFTMVYVLLGLGILVSFLSIVAGNAVEARMERRKGRER